jgi:hypothetical protein
LAEGESVEDTDDEEEEQLQLVNPLPIPELNHNSPILVKTPEPKTLSLIMPTIEHRCPIKEKEENDAFIRENFNIIEPGPDDVYDKFSNALSDKQLDSLRRGENMCEAASLDEIFNIKKIITFPDGKIIDLN